MGNKRFGWFALIIAFLFGSVSGENTAQNKARYEIERLQATISDRDRAVRQLKDENQKLKTVCPKNEADESPYDPFRAVR